MHKNVIKIETKPINQSLGHFVLFIGVFTHSNASIAQILIVQLLILIAHLCLQIHFSFILLDCVFSNPFYSDIEGPQNRTTN